MSKSTVKVSVKPGKVSTDVVALVTSLDNRGRDFTDARNAVVFRESLLSGLSGRAIATAFHLDHSDVAKVIKSGKALSATMQAKFKRLDLSGVSADDFATLTDSIALGSKLRRQVTGAAGGAAKGKGQGTTETATATTTATTGESADIEAIMWDAIFTGDIDANLITFRAFAARVEAEATRLQAEADIEAA